MKCHEAAALINSKGLDEAIKVIGDPKRRVCLERQLCLFDESRRQDAGASHAAGADEASALLAHHGPDRQGALCQFCQSCQNSRPGMGRLHVAQARQESAVKEDHVYLPRSQPGCFRRRRSLCRRNDVLIRRRRRPCSRLLPAAFSGDSPCNGCGRVYLVQHLVGFFSSSRAIVAFCVVEAERSGPRAARHFGAGEGASNSPW